MKYKNPLKPRAKSKPWYKKQDAPVVVLIDGCRRCHNTRICPTCNGDCEGCMECHSTGVCPHCCELPVVLVG